jgi:hypothetical protein
MADQRDQAIALESWWEQYREQLTAGTVTRVELFVRSCTPAPGTHDRRNRLFRSIERQVNDGPLDSYGITVLSDKFCLCANCLELYDDGLIETVERLMSWRSGGIRSIGFDEQEVRSSILDEQYTVIVPPELSLGVYVDDSLAGVFPCRADGVNCRPDAYFDGLEDGKLTELIS